MANTCRGCGGTRKTQTGCSPCGGNGVVVNHATGLYTEKCRSCSGVGVINHTCASCGGTGEAQ